MLDRADLLITRQLDLVRFLKLQKLKCLTTLSALSPPQMELVHKMSTMLIHESSDLNIGKVDDVDNSSDTAEDPPVIGAMKRRLIESVFTS